MDDVPASIQPAAAADPIDGLLQKLRTKRALIGIVGLGYVGLPLLLRYAQAGYRVLGLDIDPDKIEHLRQGRTYLKHIPAQAVQAAAPMLEATTDFVRAREADALIICVPTPLNEHREPDMQFITGTIESLLPHLRRGQVVSLESTTYPGTTEEELRPRIERAGFVVGRDIALVFSPEREDPGNPRYSTRTIPKVVAGSTQKCLEAGVELYGQAIDRIVPVSCTRTAEMTKLLENIHRAVNIGLVNEMKIVADRMGLDIYEVIRAASTKPFGFVPYFPGPGLGGHCIPIDPFYLTWKAREYGVNTRFIELAGELNSSMPHWVVEKIGAALNDRRKPIKGSRILILGIAYKKNIDDMRESPAVEIMQLLQERGATLDYSDPFVPTFPRMRRYKFELTSIALSPEEIARYDCVVLATDHQAFDYLQIQKHAQLIVDTRGVYQDPVPNVVRA
jgi:UDP-N-acetyl-D-glucosamine dehydrogenase